MREIKLIVFDLDGTLYNLDDVASMNYKMQVDFYTRFTGKTVDETVAVFEKNCLYPNICEKSKSATEFFLKNGIPAFEWNAYREEHFDITAIKEENAVSQEIMDEFKNIAPLVLLSSNSLRNIHRILKHIDLPFNLFDEIICSDCKHEIGTFLKKQEMKLIAERNNIYTNNMLSIGDRYKTDIEPMIELGGYGIAVNSQTELLRVCTALKSKNYSSIKIYGPGKGRLPEN